MKTIKQVIPVIVLVVSFFTSFYGSAQDMIENEDNPSIFYQENQKEADTEICVCITIDWGRKSKDCKGFGICDFHIHIKSETEASNVNGNLVIEFKDDALKEVKSYFGSNEIILEEDYTLSNDFCDKLKLRRGYTIKKGTYTISKNKNNRGMYSVLM